MGLKSRDIYWSLSTEIPSELNNKPNTELRVSDQQICKHNRRSGDR